MKEQTGTAGLSLLEAAEDNKKAVERVLAGSALVPREAKRVLNEQAALIARMAEALTREREGKDWF
ncbi:hypothetical protein [Burkholderia cepacia]|uniref:hypothetical protein n=1 Tax=Burkholderia cepacia TaxID=292 RepID=UPI0012DA3466|nr:hypothetical protein [Burkholderia cepacia]